MILVVAGLLVAVREATSSYVYSSCSGRGETPWNRDPATISLELESWLMSMVTTHHTSRDNVSSMLYNPVNGTFSEHWFWVNDMIDGDYIDEVDRQVRTIRLLCKKHKTIKHKLRKIKLFISASSLLLMVFQSPRV